MKIKEKEVDIGVNLEATEESSEEIEGSLEVTEENSEEVLEGKLEVDSEEIQEEALEENLEGEGEEEILGTLIGKIATMKTPKNLNIKITLIEVTEVKDFNTIEVIEAKEEVEGDMKVEEEDIIKTSLMNHQVENKKCKKILKNIIEKVLQ